MLLADACAGKARSSSGIRGKGAQRHFQQSSTNQALSKTSHFDPLITSSNGNEESPKPVLTVGGSCCRETQSAAQEGRARYLIPRADAIGVHCAWSCPGGAAAVCAHCGTGGSAGRAQEKGLGCAWVRWGRIPQGRATAALNQCCPPPHKDCQLILTPELLG